MSHFFLILFVINLKYFIINANDLINSANNTLENDVNYNSIKTTRNSNLVNVISQNTTKSNILEQIMKKLENEKVNKCEYGTDPKLIEICTGFDQTIGELFSEKNELFDMKVTHLETMMINNTIINDLKKKCVSGQWCLDDINSNESPYTPIGNKLLRKHSIEICLFSGCFNKIKSYVDHCVTSNITKSLLNTVPALCELINNGKHKHFCLESSIRLVYASIAHHYPGSNNCEENISTKKTCNNECKNIALEMSKLDSCCPNSSLTKRFSSLKWYTDYQEVAVKSCQLPITGLCLSEGKYYVGVTMNTAIAASVITLSTTVIFLVLIFVACFKKQIVIQQPFTDAYQYSQLNQEENQNIKKVEEEMMFNNNYDQDEYSKLARKLQQNDSDSNKNISRFVNQHQTDIKSLLLS